MEQEQYRREIIENMKRIMKTVLCLLAVFSFTAVPAPRTAYAADYGGFQYMVKDEEATITGYTGSLGREATIPAQLDGYTVTSIAANAFYRCGILQSVEIPASVTSIGSNAFSGCRDLRQVKYSEGSNLESIGYNAFASCGELRIVEIPAGVTSIGTNAFSYCTNLKSVTIPAGVTGISDGVFAGCFSLTSVTFAAGSKPESIGSNAFNSCSSLKNVTIPASVTAIGEGAFASCDKLGSVTFEAGSKLESIGNETFSACSSLKNVTIPAGVTAIGSNAFQYCDILESVTIPAGVTSIGDKVFLNCIALREINYGGSASQWEALVENAADWNKGCPSDMVIHYSLWDLTITVRDQTYVYNGNIQGPGDTVYEDAAEIAEVVSVEGLQGNDTITSVEIDGQASEIGEHKGVLKVTGFLINNDINAKERYNVILVPGNIIIKEEPVPPKPHVHDLTLMKAREATCTEPGSKPYYECGTCGRWFEDLTANIEITDKSSVIIKALGHDWDGGAVTKEPTYDEKGVRTYTCRRDSSHTKTEEIPEKQRISSGGSGRDEFTEPHNYIFGYDPDHDYWYCRDKGTLLKDSWAYVPYNGRTYWYHFDGNGRMQTGWLTVNGNTYYLWPVSDGWKGRMVTGYREIDGKLYYFETEAGKNQGRMYRNERTPDGNRAGPDGSISEEQDEID